MTLSSLRSDHSEYTASGGVSNHYYGRAMDIAMVDGVSCTDTASDLALRRTGPLTLSQSSRTGECRRSSSTATTSTVRAQPSPAQTTAITSTPATTAKSRTGANRSNVGAAPPPKGESLCLPT